MKRDERFGTFGVIGLAASTLLALPLVGGYFGWLHPAFDSLAHFRVHLAVLLVIVALPLLFIRRFRWNGLLATIFGVAAVASITGVPGFGPVQASYQPKDEVDPVYRLLHLNLRFDNPRPGDVLSLVGRTRPDVIAFNEVSQLWREKLDLLTSAYPHRIFCETTGRAGGVAIMSVRPFDQESPARCLEGGTLALAILDVGGRPVEVGALHLHWPWPFDQMDQINDVAPLLGAMGDASILAGDLNATPWSAAALRVADVAGMVHVGPAGPTWLHRRLPEVLRFAGLPIDHVFAKDDIVIHSSRTLEPVGSDHLPVLVEFSVRDRDVLREDAQTATAALAYR